MSTTIGKLLVSEALPDDLRDPDRVMTSDETDAVLAQVAARYPEKYRDISRDLMKLGQEASFTEGATLRVSDLLNPLGVDRDDLVKHVRQQVQKVTSNPDMTPEEKQLAIATVFNKMQKFITDSTYKQALKAKNPFALQVLSKARGNPGQLAALMATPGVYMDAEDNIIPTFIGRSYAEGLRPDEYWASTYGARKSVISTKFATRDAGYLGKQFNQASMRTVVTGDDCETPTGIPVDVDDNDNIGSVLARPSGRFPAGTVISKEVLGELRKKGPAEIVVRSPLTCSYGQGVCAQCTGLREDGKFPKIGDHVGLNASSALAERIAQGSLNTKHSGGQSKGESGGEDTYAGFGIIDQLFQLPKVFPHRATVSDLDGRVERIEEAPQGGWNVWIGGSQHYVLPESKVSVKVGDVVEAGDQISTGLVNPREVVQHKGIGAGRAYFTQQATKAFRDSGYNMNRRNMELLVRGVMDHARIDDPKGLGDYLPDDVVSYNQLAFSYRPRQGAVTRDIGQATGGYLEQPALHYSIGTRVTPSVIKSLQKHGVNRVMTHSDPPDFTPYMPGLRAVPQHEKDWMAQLGSSYLKGNLLKQVHRGGESDIHGLHPLPGIAKGVEFGRNKGIGY